MDYADVVIEASTVEHVQTAGGRLVMRFAMRVLSSPGGESERPIPVEIDEREIKETLRQLETRALDAAGLVALGRTLALLLLPPAAAGAPQGVRELFDANLGRLSRDRGLRLRLRLPAALAELPWEYLYVDRAGGGDGMDGFLALDPRISIVRHELLAAEVVPPLAAGRLNVVVALASDPALPPLDLAREQRALEQAFAGQPAIAPVFLSPATLTTAVQHLPGAAIFHFAGHGIYTPAAAGAGGASGTAALAFDDERIAAEQLAINLRGNGVRLVVLTACDSGRRDGLSEWSGVASALVKAEIPAVVANQYAIDDTAAIAFSRDFYRALSGGLSVERAVSAGRIAAYNAYPSGHDWGVPVLYLRADDSLLFAGTTDPVLKAGAAAAATATVNLKLDAIAQGAYVTGATLKRLSRGTLTVVTHSGAVGGTLTGAHIGTATGGSVDVQITASDVSGSVTGVDLDEL